MLAAYSLEKWVLVDDVSFSMNEVSKSTEPSGDSGICVVDIQVPE
jgi:hypothetical protein